MKHYFRIATMAVATLILTACGSKESGKKHLVLYYSQTGATEAVALELQKSLGADIEAIQLVEPYSGTYAETIERAGKERQEGILPELKLLKADLAKYETIFLGYPIWYGTYAMPIHSLVKNIDFEGKKIVTFCTFGSGGLEPAIADLKKALPKAIVAENGFGIRNARIAATSKELNRFLVENNYVEGSVEALSGYSEMRPVMDEEKQIFDAACSDYQFPLGTPVLVGKRGTSDGVDYVFSVENRGTTSTIYVTVSNEEGAKPEFTRVVR